MYNWEAEVTGIQGKQNGNGNLQKLLLFNVFFTGEIHIII